MGMSQNQPASLRAISRISSALAVMREQARTPFVRKTCGLDLFSHTQGRKRIVRSRQQRLADMKSREGFALKKHNRMATLPERDCCRRSSRTATGDSEIKVVLRRRRCHRIAHQDTSKQRFQLLRS